MRHARVVVVSLLLARSVCAAAVLQVLEHGVEIRSCDGMIQARRSCGGPNCETRASSPASASGGVELPGGPWEVTLQSSRCWAPAVSINGDSGILPLWPAASISGTIDAGNHVAGPLRAEYQLPEIGDPSHLQWLSAECSITNSQWSCPAPAVAFRLRLTVPQYAPHYVPRVNIAGGERKDVGSIHFDRGASVAGVVLTAAGRHDRTVVELAAAATPKAKPRRIELNDAADGLFQFTALPPDTYRLSVRCAGCFPVEVSAIRVEPQRESFLPSTIELKQAAVVDLFITPALSAAGQPWHVKLEKPGAGGSRAPAEESDASPGGEWRSRPLAAGPYTISVIDSHGSVFLQESVDAAPDAAPKFLSISRIDVRGSVRVGKIPFESHIVFIDGGERITAVTDTRGNFETVLPHDGVWEAEIRNPKETSYVTKSSVDVRRKSEAAVAEVEFALPGGRVKGRVVTEMGDPVATDVLVFRNGKPVADAGSELPDGSFDLGGLTPGPVTLQALSQAGESDAVPYVVAEDDPASAEIVLRKLIELQCRLIAEDGEPIAGAIIRYKAANMGRISQAHSGPMGEFSLRIPGNATVVFAAIAAVGFPSTFKAIDAQASTSPTVVLGMAQSLLHVVHQPDTPWPYVTFDKSVFLPVTALLTLGPDGLKGLVADGLQIPVAPGPYVFCDSMRPDSPCQQAMLAPGRELTLFPQGGKAR